MRSFFQRFLCIDYLFLIQEILSKSIILEIDKKKECLTFIINLLYKT
jgi:hypothetical protein